MGTCPEVTSEARGEDPRPESVVPALQWSGVSGTCARTPCLHLHLARTSRRLGPSASSWERMRRDAANLGGGDGMTGEEEMTAGCAGKRQGGDSALPTLSLCKGSAGPCPRQSGGVEL